jgi:hypothetical protein
VSVRHDIPPLAGARALAAAQSATSCNYGVNRSGAIVMRESPAHHRYALPAHCCLGDSQYGIAPTNVLEQQISAGVRTASRQLNFGDLAQGITFSEIPRRRVTLSRIRFRMVVDNTVVGHAPQSA